jgi:hypothetical protein
VWIVTGLTGVAMGLTVALVTGVVIRGLVARERARSLELGAHAPG